MIETGLILMMIGMCGCWFENWKGYVMVWCMAFGVALVFARFAWWLVSLLA